MEKQALQGKFAFSLKEVGELTGLSQPFLRLKVKDGSLKVTRIGRRVLVNRSSLNEFIGETEKQENTGLRKAA
jgi:excisionase family DNA binding protein